MNNRNWVIIISVAVLLLGFVFLSTVGKENIESGGATNIVNVQTPTTPPVSSGTSSTSVTQTTTAPTSKTLAYGRVVLRSGEKAQFPGLALQLVRVFDESRCPEGVTCVWAGTLKADVRTASGLGTSTQTVELGSTITMEAENITFLSATPYPKEGKSITEGQYQLTFNVTKRLTSITPTPTSPSSAQSACYTGGCSGEVCSDRKDVASNCMYREEFACYKTAKCERQANKQCGWTETATLRSCLQSPPKM